jgi:hypothetical protein
LWTGSALLAAAVVVGAFAVAGGLGRIRQGADELEVTGSARRPIRSDFVVWRLAVGAQEPTLAAAYQRVRGQSERVRAFLRGRGVADSALVVQPVSVSALPEYTENGNETGRLLGYRVAQRFEVRSADVDGITRLTQEVGDLIDQGVGVVPSPPEYLFTRLAELRVAMLGEATADAKARAEAIAAAAGSRVGTARRVRVGVFQITPRFSTEVSDYGVNDVTALEKDVTAVVRVTFAIR